MLFQLKRNDDKQSLVYIIQNEDGTTPILTGATVRFVMGKKNKLIINSPAIIQSETDGIVAYDFKDADTLIAGTYMAEFIVTFPNEEQQTFPNRGYITVHIEPNLDTNQTNIIVDMLAEREGEFTKKLESILLQAGNISMSTMNEYSWTSTEGQLTYIMPDNANYDPFGKWFEVYVGGVPVDPFLIDRSVANKFTLLIESSLVPSGMNVIARWTEPIVPVTVGHHSVHEENGSDEIDLTKLRGYKYNILDKLKSIVTPQMFGAVGDMITDDTNAVREAIAFAELNNYSLFLPSIYLITGEVEIKKPILIYGNGSGSGYADDALTEYRQISGFLVKGTGAKRIRTRVKYRASITDPQDSPLSVALNIQAENVVLRDFTILLDFDKTDNAPTNYGADWDIGLFLGCRVHNSLENVHVLGYWREASIYEDVTRSSYTPEFKDINGVAYDFGTVRNGADGLTMKSVFTQGGKWGLKIQGAQPKAGETAYSTDYYDELTGGTVIDRRGNFGASDVTAIACSFYGVNHHSKYRKNDTINNYLTDTAGGSISIDGLAGNASGALQGMRFISCRFSTWEAFRIRLDRVNRPVFIGCHSEGGSGALKTNGSPVLYDDTDYYGPISTTSNTKNVVLVAFNSTLRPAFIGSTDYTNIASAGSDISNFAKGINVTGDGLFTGALTINGSLFRTTGEMDIRAASGSGVRLRHGSSSLALIDSNYATFYSALAVRPSADNVSSLGIAANRYTEAHLTNGIVVTTPDSTKKYRIKVDNAGVITTTLVP
jgi:hypothetical protein